MADILFTPLTLPNGAVVQNRLCKAAMEENMAEYGQLPGEGLFNLYERWANAAAGAQAGPGIILSGNVMVDPTALTGPGGVVLQRGTLDDPKTRERFERLAKSGQAGGSKFVMQISHPGRQVFGGLGFPPVSASSTKVTMSGVADKMFKPARTLSGDEIHALIARFADTAFAAEQAGFDGVQVHGAHGYLVAQFLSPLTNLRLDEWGGSLENRARFLLEILRAIRAKVKPGFIVGVKINSADFQRGGFEVEDSMRVIEWLNDEAVDFVEISGGSYESAAMMGTSEDGRVESSTQKRELYFFDFAKQIRASAKMPLMVTGGVTKKSTAQEALGEAGVDMVGIARAFSYNPHLCADWKAGRALEVQILTAGLKDKGLSAVADLAMTSRNLNRMGAGKKIKSKQRPVLTVMKQRLQFIRTTKRYKSWIATQNLEP